MEQELRSFIRAVADCHGKLKEFVAALGRQVAETWEEAGCPEKPEEEDRLTEEEFLAWARQEAASSAEGLTALYRRAGLLDEQHHFVWDSGKEEGS